MLRFFSKSPNLKNLDLQRYRFNFSLDRLASGVDNIHTDVNVSPEVYTAVAEITNLLLIRHSKTESFFGTVKKDRLDKKKEGLRTLCTDVLLEGIHKAKSESEVQIDWLAQVSLTKICLEEVKIQFDRLIGRFEKLIRDYQLSQKLDQIEVIRFREKLTDIKHQKKNIVRLAGEDLLQLLTDINTDHLNNIRESNFPPEDILPENFLLNPMLHIDSIADDNFLISDYVLLSQRSGDPDNYGNLVFIIHDTLSRTDLGRHVKSAAIPAEDDAHTYGSTLRHPAATDLDPWLMETDNIERMLNYFESMEGYQRLKARKESRSNLRKFKKTLKTQRKLLNLFYRQFKKSNLMKRIVAFFEMQPLYQSYCPPLLPWQVREYLVRPGSRKQIVRQLKRLKTFYGNSFSLSPLNKTIRRIKKCPLQLNRQYLLAFLERFARYHRDLKNYILLKKAIDGIHLAREKKILALSRENRSLYEFMLPNERIIQEKPIINHVIIKADIRGSTDITYHMKDQGLNPASYFSLNFFDPISEILFEYGGSKEFIEGDAIILSIVEREDTPGGWYSVARACGLAVRMLRIVRQYNINSQKHRLPILELGIGICYHESAPAFLFDGESRIMISPAINLADRLSSCDKSLLRHFKVPNPLFNLYVFQHASGQGDESTVEDASVRYNINGIELSPSGFAKLAGEINLKSFTYPAENEKVQLYVGKVPTLSDNYQYLVIREAPVLALEAVGFKVVGSTSSKYYEVCSHPQLYEFVQKMF